MIPPTLPRHSANSLNGLGSHIDGAGLFPAKEKLDNHLPDQSFPSEADWKDGYGRFTEVAGRADDD